MPRGALPATLDLQLVARAIVDLRLTSVRKFQRSGGAAVLPALFFEQVCAESGGRVARQALLTAAERREITADDLDARTPKAREAGAEALAALKVRGVLRARARGRREAFALAHVGLTGTVESFAIEDRARAAAARRARAAPPLHVRRAPAPARAWAVHRHLGGTSRARRAGHVHAQRAAQRPAKLGLGVALTGSILVALYGNMRRSYTLGFEPRDAGGSARVVVRLGREGLSFLSFLPNRPRFGAVIADTGFSAAGLSSDTAARIGAGKASGSLDACGPDGVGRRARAWLAARDAERAAPRAARRREGAHRRSRQRHGAQAGLQRSARAAGDAARRSPSSGAAGAGEDEILAAALTDSAPEIRRRGVEVAASIDRRQGNGAHGATLRSAVRATSPPDVRATVLRETLTLPPSEAASILTVALRDPDPTFRHGAEEATSALAARAPGAAVGALEQVLQSPDEGVRRAALALLEVIAARDRGGVRRRSSRRVVANEQAPEEARVAALLLLRRAGCCVSRAAAAAGEGRAPRGVAAPGAATLPLYARLVTPEQAEGIARTEMKGSPTARGGRAVMGHRGHDAPRSRRQGAARPALRSGDAETRLEAARSFGYLKREGVELAEKGHEGSQRRGREGRDRIRRRAGAHQRVRRRRSAGARPQERPAHGAPQRHRGAGAHRRDEAGRRHGAAGARAQGSGRRDARRGGQRLLRALSDKNAAAASPYLRIAARDERDEVRTAAAACLGELAQADPKGAARIAAWRAGRGRAARGKCASPRPRRWGGWASRRASWPCPGLLKLVGDPERSVRIAALRRSARSPRGGGGEEAARPPGPCSRASAPPRPSTR